MEPRTLLSISAAVLLAFAVLPACGDSSDDADPTGIEPAVKVDPETMPEDAHLIDQKDLKFLPNTLTVKAGEVLYFKNSETAVHTVTINGRDVTGDMRRDEVMTWTPPGPGVYKFTCDYHPQMRATVTVE